MKILPSNLAAILEALNQIHSASHNVVVRYSQAGDIAVKDAWTDSEKNSMLILSKSSEGILSISAAFAVRIITCFASHYQIQLKVGCG